MNRRDVLKLIAASGVSLYLPSRPVVAQSDRYLVMFSAQGAWDPTSFIDPKGNIDSTGKGIVNSFDVGDIRTEGAFSLGPQINPELYDFTQFFVDYSSDILVFNGINVGGTNNHDIGKRIIWTGTDNTEYPCLAALFAAVHAPQAPMPFYSGGYHDKTAGLVPVGAIRGIDQLVRIAKPNYQDVVKNNALFFDHSVAAEIESMKRSRLDYVYANNTLPKRLDHIQHIINMKDAGYSLSPLVDALPSDISDDPFIRQAQVVCAAFSSGSCASANINLNGFDTHDDHDRLHYDLLSTFFLGLSFLMQEAERQGIRDKLTVVVGSDFGRNPYYNGHGGKDHWPITSMLVIDSNIRGNRVIGGTTDSLQALPISTSTLDTLEQDDGSGLYLTPETIHKSLRHYLGLSGSPLVSDFALDGMQLDFFT